MAAWVRSRSEADTDADQLAVLEQRVNIGKYVFQSTARLVHDARGVSADEHDPSAWQVGTMTWPDILWVEHKSFSKDELLALFDQFSQVAGAFPGGDGFDKLWEAILASITEDEAGDRRNFEWEDVAKLIKENLRSIEVGCQLISSRCIRIKECFSSLPAHRVILETECSESFV